MHEMPVTLIDPEQLLKFTYASFIPLLTRHAVEMERWNMLMGKPLKEQVDRLLTFEQSLLLDRGHPNGGVVAISGQNAQGIMIPSHHSHTRMIGERHHRLRPEQQSRIRPDRIQLRHTIPLRAHGTI